MTNNNEIVTFYGKEKHDNGLPKPFKRYKIYSVRADYLGDDKHVASICAISIDANMPAELNHIGNDKLDALNKAINYLKELPENKILYTDIL